MFVIKKTTREEIRGIFLIPFISSTHPNNEAPCELLSQFTVSLQLCDPLQQEPASSLLHLQSWGDN
jgi:hypothetical protein